MIGQVIGAVVRAILQTLGGGMVQQGLLNNDDLTKAIGAIIFLVTLAWSIWQKKQKQSTLGGAFNPKADVRRAKRNGSALLPLLACIAASVTMALAAPFSVQRYAAIEGKSVPITYTIREDARPFLVRLLASLRPSLGWKLAQNEMTGTVRPVSYTLTLTGGAEF